MRTRPERPLHRLGRWLIYLGLVLAGGTGYTCGASCTRAQPPSEPPGALVAAPPTGQSLLACAQPLGPQTSQGASR